MQLDAWRLAVLTILVLLLRRIPIVLATYRWIPDIKTFREAIFAGWFGPMGVGAIFISTLARLAIPDGEAEKDTAQVDNLKETIIPIVSFLVLSSVASRKLSLHGSRVKLTIRRPVHPLLLFGTTCT